MASFLVTVRTGVGVGGETAARGAPGGGQRTGLSMPRPLLLSHLHYCAQRCALAPYSGEAGLRTRLRHDAWPLLPEVEWGGEHQLGRKIRVLHVVHYIHSWYMRTVAPWGRDFVHYCTPGTYNSAWLTIDPQLICMEKANVWKHHFPRSRNLFLPRPGLHHLSCGKLQPSPNWVRRQCSFPSNPITSPLPTLQQVSHYV